MLIQIIVDSIIDLFNAVVSWLPAVTALPTVAGFDMDTALSQGIGAMRSFFGVFWPLAIIFDGFLLLVAYYGVKMLLTVVLGSRAPHAK